MFFKIDEKEKIEQKSEPKVFDDSNIEKVLFFIKENVGIDLFLKEHIIKNRLKFFCEKRDIFSFSELFLKTKLDNNLKQEVINLITVNETYFFREERQLEEIVKFLLNLKKEAKVLCAPCSSGEEVYTLAIMLREAKRDFNYRIYGIDIDSKMVDKAKKALYSSRALHKIEQNLAQKYFTFQNEKYILKKDLFSFIDFRVANIFDEDFCNGEKFDLVISRNMFIYFDEQTRLKALNIFKKCLKSDGRLYLGHADIVPKNDFLKKCGYGAKCYFYIKDV